MKRIGWLLVFISILGTHACENENDLPLDIPGDQSGKVMDSSGSTLFDGQWILVDYKRAPLTTDLRRKVTLTFQNSPVAVHLLSGRSFVNGYSGYFTIDEDHALITYDHDLISTLMGGTDEQNAAETMYFKLMRSVESYELNGNSLTLHFGTDEAGYFIRK
jgi:heat shock protein HslJ